jgi:hypothetical protein
MRTLAEFLVVASAVGAATLGVAGPAHAGTTLCAQQPLRHDNPDILVVTCVEAEGDNRRALSTVINGAGQAIELTELESLISFPEYGSTDCGASRLEPGAQAACVSPWVTARAPWSTTRAAAFSLIRAIDAQGRYIAVVADIQTDL